MHYATFYFMALWYLTFDMYMYIYLECVICLAFEDIDLEYESDLFP